MYLSTTEGKLLMLYKKALHPYLKENGDYMEFELGIPRWLHKF